MQAFQTSSSPTLVEAPGTANWLQVLSHLNPRYGGMAALVPLLARAAEARQTHACGIVGFCDEAELEYIPADQRASVCALPPNRSRWLVDAGLRSQLKDIIRKSDGVHIHGIWETHCTTTAGMARACKRPYIIAAHGMLDPWALRQKRLKKAVYAALVETRTLQRAACLHALTQDEVDDYRRLGLSNPIAIIPNGVDVPPEISADGFWKAHPHLMGKRIVLFLGRMHYKKGLHLLLQAWSRVRSTDDQHLVIAGPDTDNILASLVKLRDELKLQSSVTFAGMQVGPEKWSALAAADLFVLPSYSEGFSVAVLEAMGVGVPVLVTTPCHIPEVATNECGFVIQPELEPLEGALRDFFQLSHRDAARMGERARQLVNRSFRWSVVGKQITEVYDWLQGGSKPSGVAIV